MKMKDVAPCEFFANSSIVTFEGQTVVRIDPGPTSRGRRWLRAALRTNCC